MTTLKTATVAELKAELVRKEKSLHQLAEKPDFTAVIELVQDNYEYFAENHYEIKDIEHYIYDTVIEAVFDDPLAYIAWRNKILMEQ